MSIHGWAKRINKVLKEAEEAGFDVDLDDGDGRGKTTLRLHIKGTAWTDRNIVTVCREGDQYHLAPSGQPHWGLAAHCEERACK